MTNQESTDRDFVISVIIVLVFIALAGFGINRCDNAFEEMVDENTKNNTGYLQRPQPLPASYTADEHAWLRECGLMRTGYACERTLQRFNAKKVTP
jgi:hypothetical protein